MDIESHVSKGPATDYYVKCIKIASYLADNSQAVLMKRLTSKVQPFKGI